MSNAKNKLAARITSMTEGQIEEALVVLNMEWDAYTPEQRTVRSYLLAEYEARNGGDMVDALLDKLDGMVAA